MNTRVSAIMLARSPDTDSHIKELQEIILALLGQESCALDEADAVRFNSLSYKKLRRLHVLCLRLKKYDMLDKMSFVRALDAAAIKLPEAERSSFQKHKQKDFTRVDLDDAVTIFVPKGSSRQQAVRGSYGWVVKAFDSPDATVPKWAVKYLKGGVNDNRLKSARREVKQLRYAGKQAYFFATDKSVKIVMPWQSGDTVCDLYAKKKIPEFSFEQRLQWCIGFLMDLVAMYQRFTKHGDAAGRNAIVDTKTGKATFVDFGLSAKIIPTRETDWFQSDSSLFANRFLQNYSIFHPELNAARGQSLHVKAIMRLYEAMCIPSYPCSVDKALDYCQQIYNNLDNLSHQKINEIAAATINSTQLTVDDLLHGNERAAMIKSGLLKL